MGVAETGGACFVVGRCNTDAHHWLGLFARWREAHGLTMLRIVYFAGVREALGIDSEELEIDAGANIAALVDQLAQHSELYASAFSDRTKLRFALDQKMVRADALLDNAKELAIFPPVTGG